MSYRYRRYYWYGCHPYRWYGYSLSEPLTTHNTYNTYNTYNYYNEEPSEQPVSFDYDRLIEQYERDKQTAEDLPQNESPADMCFQHAVKAFEDKNYAEAVTQLREAVNHEPDDIVLPFTYAQALFATGDYAHATSVIRAALNKMPEDEQTIYYPRGLYKEEDILKEQVETLRQAANAEPFDADFKLLLGYQLLGMGQLEQAEEPLKYAQLDPANETASQILLDMLEKAKEDLKEESKS